MGLSPRQFTREFKLVVAQGAWVPERSFCARTRTMLAGDPL
jgi:hypothetical protein